MEGNLTISRKDIYLSFNPAIAILNLYILRSAFYNKMFMQFLYLCLKISHYMLYIISYIYAYIYVYVQCNIVQSIKCIRNFWTQWYAHYSP